MSAAASSTSTASDPLLNTAQAARVLGVSRWWFGELVRRGQVGPCARIGNRIRVRLSILEEYLERLHGDPEDPYMSYNDIADYLGISAWTAGELVRHGEIPGQRVGRRMLVTRSAVDQYVEQRLV